MVPPAFAVPAPQNEFCGSSIGLYLALTGEPGAPYDENMAIFVPTGATGPSGPAEGISPIDLPPRTTRRLSERLPGYSSPRSLFGLISYDYTPPDCSVKFIAIEAASQRKQPLIFANLRETAQIGGFNPKIRANPR